MTTRVKLQGLDPEKNYKVQEINVQTGRRSYMYENNKNFSGDYLMKVGINFRNNRELVSSVVELTEVE